VAGKPLQRQKLRTTPRGLLDSTNSGEVCNNKGIASIGLIKPYE
jgi:hypothetical protein